MPAPESRSAPRSSLPGSFRSSLSALVDGAEDTKRPPVFTQPGAVLYAGDQLFITWSRARVRVGP